MTDGNENRQSLLRSLPAVDRLVKHEAIQAFTMKQNVSHHLLVVAAKEVLQKWRNQLLNEANRAPEIKTLVDEIIDLLTLWLSPQLQRVINGTGVVLHTNLGRAPLDATVLDHIVETASHYSNLEYNIATGARGSRDSHIEDLICHLTGAEAATIVNNNAAAVFLVLRELAKNQEVIVSRGQLVEIGGSFRVSEIMIESGAQIVEVGTTNKTHLADYERAITENTGLLLKVHTSNFRMVGFTNEVSRKELVELAHKNSLPLYEDLGSGVLIDLKNYGIGDEPVVKDVLASGIDLVSFSGDKLLGGPQVGIIAGKKQLIQRIKQNQLARTFRIDKLTLAGLEAVLRQYLHPETMISKNPILRDIIQPIDDIKDKAEVFKKQLAKHNYSHLKVTVVDELSAVGGGTLPGIMIPSQAVLIEFTNISASEAAALLRFNDVPIIVRIKQDRLLIDFRTIRKNEIDILVEAVLKIDTRAE